MIGKRYEYDGIPLFQLNTLQIEMKKQVEQKINEGIYEFEEVTCPICRKKDFDILATKDRYGLYVPVVICKQCGLIQTNPRMNQKAYNEFYNIEYRKLYHGKEVPTKGFFEWQYRTGRRIFNYLGVTNSLLKSPTELLVLEIGCAAGGILQYFKEMGYRVKGIDLNDEYIEFGKSQHGLDLSVGTLAETDLDEPPNLIIYTQVLEHILSLNKEFQQVHRVLSPEGIIYVETPGVKNLMHSYDMDFLLLLQNAHTYHFTLTSLNNLMQKNGFDMIVGNEDIKSVFKIRSSSSSIGVVNDYSAVIRYLKRVERFRKFLPIQPNKIKPLSISLLIKILKFVGVYNITRNLYHKIK